MPSPASSTSSCGRTRSATSNSCEASFRSPLRTDPQRVAQRGRRVRLADHRAAQHDGDRLRPGQAAADRVTESGKPANEADGVEFLRMEGDRAEFRVGSGDYHFVSNDSNR